MYRVTTTCETYGDAESTVIALRGLQAPCGAILIEPDTEPDVCRESLGSRVTRVTVCLVAAVALACVAGILEAMTH